MKDQQSELTIREEFFNYLLIKRRPEATDQDSAFAKLASAIGAEAIVRTIDIMEGFITPKPSELQLSVFALHKELQDETKLSMWVTIG